MRPLLRMDASSASHSFQRVETVLGRDAHIAWLPL
jgi:hypothetical protein